MTHVTGECAAIPYGSNQCGGNPLASPPSEGSVPSGRLQPAGERFGVGPSRGNFNDDDRDSI